MRKMREEAINELIRNYEGYYGAAYKCPAGYWTLGYGSRIWFDGEHVKKGMTCTKAEAERVLRRDLKSFEEWVDAKLAKKISAKNVNGGISEVEVPQWLFEANVSLCYNIGCGAWAHSTALRKINEGGFIKKG